MFLPSFKAGITSGDPLRVKESMQEASLKILDVIFLNYFGKNISEDFKSEFIANILKNQTEIHKLVNNIKEKKITGSEMETKLSLLLGVSKDESQRFNSQLNLLKNGSVLTNQENACIAIIFSVFYFVTVVSGVNIEFGLNIHQIQNFHTHKNVKVDISNDKIAGLNEEMLYAAIANNL